MSTTTKYIYQSFPKRKTILVLTNKKNQTIRQNNIFKSASKRVVLTWLNYEKTIRPSYIFFSLFFRLQQFATDSKTCWTPWRPCGMRYLQFITTRNVIHDWENKYFVCVGKSHQLKNKHRDVIDLSLGDMWYIPLAPNPRVLPRGKCINCFPGPGQVTLTISHLAWVSFFNLGQHE